MQLIRTLAAWRPDLTDYRNVASAYRIALKSLARRYLELHDEIADLDCMIGAIVDELAPDLVARNSIGHAVAAQLLLTAGDNSRAPAFRGQLRGTVRRQPGPSLVRQDDRAIASTGAAIAQPTARCTSSPSDGFGPTPNQGLCRQAHRRGPFQARGHPVPQALHRARGLHPHQPTKTGDQPGPDRRLTNRRASVGCRPRAALRQARDDGWGARPTQRNQRR